LNIIIDNHIIENIQTIGGIVEDNNMKHFIYIIRSLFIYNNEVRASVYFYLFIEDLIKSLKIKLNENIQCVKTMLFTPKKCLVLSTV